MTVNCDPRPQFTDQLIEKRRDMKLVVVIKYPEIIVRVSPSRQDLKAAGKIGHATPESAIDLGLAQIGVVVPILAQHHAGLHFPKRQAKAALTERCRGPEHLCEQGLALTAGSAKADRLKHWKPLGDTPLPHDFRLIVEIGEVECCDRLKWVFPRRCFPLPALVLVFSVLLPQPFGFVRIIVKAIAVVTVRPGLAVSGIAIAGMSADAVALSHDAPRAAEPARD